MATMGQVPLPTQYRNPVLTGFYPDPSVIRVGDDFYLVNSTFGYFPGLSVFHSRNMVDWTQLGNAIDRPGQIRTVDQQVSLSWHRFARATKEPLRNLSGQGDELRMHLDACDARIELHARDDESCAQLRPIVGVGPLTADAAVATVGNAREFKRGRQMAAWLDLGPMRHSSGGHARLGESTVVVVPTCARY